VDLDVLVEAGEPTFELVDEPAREALGLGQRELAEFGPGARDRAAPERRRLDPQPGGLELAREVGGPLVGHVRDQEVLHRGDPELARAVEVGEPRGRLHLGRCHPAAQHRDPHRAVARLFLRVDAHVIAVDVLGRILGRGLCQAEAEPTLELGLEALDRPAVAQEQELQARLLPILAEHAAVAEDLGDPADHRQHLVPADERVEAEGEVGVRRQPAAHADREPDLARLRVAQGGESDVVDLGIRAPGPAARDRDLVLARQVVELGVAVEHPSRRLHERRGVDDLVGVDSCERAAGDVARVVAARSHRREADPPQGLEDLRQVLDPHPVELDVLPHREVGDSARVPLRQARDRPELVGDEPAARDPDPHHEVREGLTLSAFAADGADTVALRVDPPPPEVRPEPLRRDRLETLAGEAPDLAERLPRVQLLLETLDPLRLGLRDCIAHRRLRTERAEGGTRSGSGRSAFVFAFTFGVSRPVGPTEYTYPDRQCQESSSRGRASVFSNCYQRGRVAQPGRGLKCLAVASREMRYARET